MTSYPIQTTFGRGILSPRLHGRVDIEHWRAGLADALNMVTLRQGGATRRPATQYVGLAKKQGASDVVRLMPFVYSSTQSYMLEHSDLVARFWTLDGQVMSGGSPYELATPWDELDITDLQHVQSGDVIYSVHPSYPPQKISRLAETSWTCADVDLQDGPYQDINTTATRLTPSGTGDLVPTMSGASAPSGTASASTEYSASFPAWKAFDKDASTAWATTNAAGQHWLKYDFGSAKVVSGYSVAAASGSATNTINNNVGPANYAPRRWLFQGSTDDVNWVTLDSQVGQTGWSDAERRFYTLQNASAFRYYRLLISDRNDSNPTWWVAIGEFSMQGADADVQTVQVTASSVTGINDGVGFKSTDVGRHLRFYSDAAYWHWGVITARNSSTSVDLELRSPPFPNTGASSTWRLGAFSDETGYPGTISFYGDRLSYARTTQNPRTKWTSRAVDLDDFSSSIPAQDDDAFNLTIPEGGAINWLSEDEDILLGTDVSVRSVGQADKNAGFSATNFKLGRKIHAGSDRVQPIIAGGATLFIERFGKAIREITFAAEINGYSSSDISILSEHLFSAKVIRLAYCATPNSLVWGLLDDGTLIAITYEREQQMVALHRHEIGGGAFVEDIASMPGTEGWELWLCVRRTNSGSTIRTIEKMAEGENAPDREDACHLDCRITYDGAAATTISGIPSVFNGMTFQVYADGMQDSDAVVSSGAVTLGSGTPASRVHVGFDHEAFIKLLPLQPTAADGGALGKRKNVTKVKVSLLSSGGAAAQAEGQPIERLQLRGTAASIDEPHPLYTGVADIRPASSWINKGEGFKILADGPEALTVRAVILAVEGEP